MSETATDNVSAKEAVSEVCKKTTAEEVVSDKREEDKRDANNGKEDAATSSIRIVTVGPAISLDELSAALGDVAPVRTLALDRSSLSSRQSSVIRVVFEGCDAALDAKEALDGVQFGESYVIVDVVGDIVDAAADDDADTVEVVADPDSTPGSDAGSSWVTNGSSGKRSYHRTRVVDREALRRRILLNCRI